MRSASFPVGMPRLPSEVLNSVFYLYQSVADAEAGKPFGGTGCFVGVPTGIDGGVFVYAVTNWHVAVRDGASVIRVNKPGGGVDCFDLDPADWTFRHDGADLAVVSIPYLRRDAHQAVALVVDMFLDAGTIAALGIGSGDDIFMIGRFVDHDGAASNVPAARFGNISVMPQLIEQPNGTKDRPSFILDIHSRTGYSGSPVFVYRTIGADLTTDQPLRIGPDTHFIKLLGVHWGQFPEQWEINSGKAPTSQGAVLSGDERYVEGLSGMTLAIPAWEIREMLELPRFREDRDRRRMEIKRQRGGSSVAESAVAITEANPAHERESKARDAG
jgi:Trypsin-like peptidase domain